MIDVDHAEVPGLLGSPEVDTDGQVAPVPRGQEPARLGVARLLRQRLRIEDQSFGRRNAVADHDARYRPAGIRAEVEIALERLIFDPETLPQESGHAEAGWFLPSR